MSRLPVLAVSAAIFALGSSGSVGAQDYQPSFHPETLKGPPAGAPNEVLVLATAHLSGMPKTFDPRSLDPLLDRLAAWHPTAIATEDLSGLQCDTLRRYPSRYAATVSSYCPDPTAAGVALAMDVPAANAEAERLLAAWPASPTSAQRRQLAAVLLAAGERHSALVQWLRLPSAERHAGDGLTAELAAGLDTLAVRRNESGLIAAALAARLGLERLWSVDDHSADTPDPSDPAEAKAANDAIMGAWEKAAQQAEQAEKDHPSTKPEQPPSLLDMYRAFNAPDAAMAVYHSDFGAALVEPSPKGYGRSYVGYWETRNLRMVANMRDVLGQHPGTRMLAIVGASHKGYYEAYLNEMHDVKLVDALSVLK